MANKNKLVLVISDCPQSINAEMGSSWQARHYRVGGIEDEKEKWGWLLRCAIGSEYGEHKGFNKVKITFKFPDRRGRDVDNYVAGAKRCLQDGLVRLGFLDDDRNALVKFHWEVTEGEVKAKETVIELSKERKEEEK